MTTPTGGDTSQSLPRSVGRSAWRGARHRCPACGQGALFHAYLKPVSACAVCGSDFSHIHAEDGPAWLTVLMFGPILLPLTVLVIFSGLPRIITLPLMMVSFSGAVLLVLPRVKGGFIGALWALRIQPGERIP